MGQNSNRATTFMGCHIISLSDDDVAYKLALLRARQLSAMRDGQDPSWSVQWTIMTRYT